MGVMQCDRKECENIMCDRYSDKHGYICNECFEELCTRDRIISAEVFMKTRRPEVLPKINVTEHYDKVFPRTGT